MQAINQRCPRSGKPVAANALTRYRGWPVGFCNPGCRDDFAAHTQACEADRRYFDALIAERGLDRDGSLPTLEGRRLRLRMLGDADVPALYAVFSDPEVMRFWSHLPFDRPAQAREYLDAIRAFACEGTLLQWGVARRADDAVLGTVTLANVDHANRRAEIGFALGRAHWGQGLGREAVSLALAHAFDALQLARISADVDPRNGASLRTLEHLGFHREGEQRQSWRVGGDVQDSILLGLLAGEWIAYVAHAAASDPQHA